MNRSEISTRFHKSVAAPPRHADAGVPLGTWGRVGLCTAFVVANAARARVTGAIVKLDLASLLSEESQATLVRQGSR